MTHSGSAAAAKPGEDLRWRIAPRWAQVAQLVVALLFLVNVAIQSNLSTSGGLVSVATMISFFAACAFLANFIVLGGWTSANRDGLRTFNGLRHRELRWGEIEQIGRKRLAIWATARDGETVRLPGVMQSRLGELTHIWAHYRGADVPQQALAHDARGGLWPVEPSRRFQLPGAVLAILALVGAMVTALVVGIAVGLATENIVWVILSISVPLVVSLIPPVRMAIAGTTIKPDGIAIRLPWTTRTIAWQDVQQVVGAGEYTGVVSRGGQRSLLYGVPAAQWQVVEGLRVAAGQRQGFA